MVVIVFMTFSVKVENTSVVCFYEKFYEYIHTGMVEAIHLCTINLGQGLGGQI